MQHNQTRAPFQEKNVAAQQTSPARPEAGLGMRRRLLYRRRVNIRICSPVHGDPRARFAASLVALVIRSMKEGLSVTWGLQSSSSIINSLRALAEEAVERGDDYLL